MSEIPPDKSIVAIQSSLYGTYLTACPDQKSVILHKVNDPNKLPKNCLWTLRSKPVLGYEIASLKFISCYGRQLSVKGYVRRKSEVCQENYITGFTRLGSAHWTYDQLGTNGSNEGYRLMPSVSGLFMCAMENGQVSIDFNPFYLCTEPEAYWKIHHVLNNDVDAEFVPLPSTPGNMQPCNNAVRKDDEDQPERRGMVIKVYNRVMAMNSGGNVNNGRGEQHNGGVKAANTEKLYRQ